ncbi:MAG: VOC family protein [Pseudomonadota bacterium]
MPDRITANLPSRDFDETEAFYSALGFERLYRGEGWMVMSLEGMELDFFPHPDLKPEDSWFSASMRLNDIDKVYAAWSALDMFQADGTGVFLKPPTELEDAPRMFFLGDPNGSLWRVMESGDPS